METLAIKGFMLKKNAVQTEVSNKQDDNGSMEKSKDKCDKNRLFLDTSISD